MATIIKSVSGYDIMYGRGAHVYTDAWEATSGNLSAMGNLIIGQKRSSVSWPFEVYRTYLWFDTSPLPSDVVIASAKLYLYNRNAVSDYNNSFHIKIQRGTELDANGIPVVHHTPYTWGDYDKALVNGTCIYPVIFSGVGLNDAVSDGTFTGTVNIDYKIEIDSIDPESNDTFKWSDDGGSTWNATLVPITGAAQDINNGVTIAFEGVIGHTLSDYWTFTAYNNAGVIHASNIPEAEGYFCIELNQQGVDWINKGVGAISKFCLRTDKDMEGIEPVLDVNKYLSIRGAFGGDESQFPYLEIICAAEITTQAPTQMSYDYAMGNGTIVSGSGIIERGFEVKVHVDFFGVGPQIFWNLIGFYDEGEIVYHDFGQRTGYLVKRETEEGEFEIGEFAIVLGKTGVLGSPSAAFNDALEVCTSYTYRAYMIIGDTTYFGDWVAFDTPCYPQGTPVDDQVPIESIIPPLPLPDAPIDITQPPITPPDPWMPPYYEPPVFDVPEVDLPDFAYPDFEPSLEGSWLRGFYYRKAYRKKDLDDLRRKCRAFQDNMVEYALVLNHNVNVMQQFLNDMTDYIGSDEYNTFKRIIPTQYLNALARRPLKLNDFKVIINEFISNCVDNANNVNNNFTLIKNGLEDPHYAEDREFKDIVIKTRFVDDENPDVERLKKVVDALNIETINNFATINHNLEIMRGILI